MASTLPEIKAISAPFAENGTRNTIPLTQQNPGNGLASYDIGFPPETSIPVEQGGIPPERADMNALGNIATQSQWFLQQGGYYTFNQAVSDAIGGYPEGAILYYMDNAATPPAFKFLRSKVGDNTTNFIEHPESIGSAEDAVWEDVTPVSPGGMPIGTMFMHPGKVPPAGAFILNGQTIENCSTRFPDFWNFVTSGVVRTVTDDEYTAELNAAKVCGAYVVRDNGSLRLPDNRNGVFWGSDPTTVGSTIPDGLPNITGTFNGASWTTKDTGGVFQNKSSSNLQFESGSNPLNGRVMSFDASRSNAAYGKSNAVQPRGISGLPCVWVYNSTEELSEQAAAEITSALQLAAQTDLSNVDTNIDFVTQSYQNGSSWYRKYRSGWVEQGGTASDPGTWNGVTFPVEMGNTDYDVSPGLLQSSGTIAAVRNLTATGMEVYCPNSNSASGVRWRISGWSISGGNVTPGGGGSGGDVAGAFTLAKVLSYTPALAQVVGTSSVTFSGFSGTVWAWDDAEESDIEIDTANFNTTWNVTADTERNTDPLTREFTAVIDGKTYILYKTGSGNNWAIGFSKESEIVFLEQDEPLALQSGEFEWTDYDTYFTVTQSVVTTTYAAEEEIISAAVVDNTAVNNEIRTFAASGEAEAVEITGYDETPEAGKVYVLIDGNHLGSKVNVPNGINGLAYYANFGSAANPAELGSLNLHSNGPGRDDYFARYIDDNGVSALELSGHFAITDFPGSSLGADDFTIYMKWKANTVNNAAFGTRRFALFSAGGASAIAMDTNAGVYNIWAGNGSGWNILSGDNSYNTDPASHSGRSNVPVTENVFHKIVFTRNGDVWDLYVDGVLALHKVITNVSNQTNGIRQINPLCGNIQLNRWDNGSYVAAQGSDFQSVEFAEFAVYRRGMTAAEVELF